MATRARNSSLKVSGLLCFALFLAASLSNASSPSGHQQVDALLKRIITKIETNKNTLGLAVTPPTLAVVGMQTAGKTSLIESYLGFKAGFTSDETGTRCPVKYILHRDLSKKEPEITLRRPDGASEKVPVAKLGTEVEKYMKKVMRLEEYSSDILEVEVRFENTADIVFLDLPGFVSENADAKKAKLIQQITLPYARDPNNILVLVVRATEDPETVFDYDLLDRLFTDEHITDAPPRPDWKQSGIFVVNYINRSFDKITSVQQANRYFGRRVDERRYYVILKPDRHDPNDMRSFAKMEQYEKEQFERWKADLSKKDTDGSGLKVTWDPSNDRAIGLANAKNQIYRYYLDSFRQALPKIVQQMSDQLQETKAQLSLAEQSAQLSDPKHLRSRYNNYTLDYTRQMKALLHGTPIKDEDYGDWTSKAGERFDPSAHGETFMEQIGSAADWHTSLPPEWKWFISAETLKEESHFGGSGFGREFDYPLLGKAAFDRLSVIFSYLLLLQKAHEYTDADIVMMGSDSRSNQFPTADVVQTMVHDKLRAVGKGIDWFLYQALYIYCSPTVLIRNYLTDGQYADIKAHSTFLKDVDRSYIDFVQNKAETLRSRWNDDIRTYCVHLEVDAPVRNLLGFIAQPAENIIWPPTFYHPDPLLVQTKEASIEGQFLSDLNREPYAVSPRINEQYEAIVGIRSEILQYRRKFPLSDYVLGGHASIPPMDRNHIDFDAIRSIANGYYFGLMERLVFNLKKRSFRILVTELMDLLGSTIEQSLAQTWMKLSDDELTRQTGLDTQALQEEAKRLKERVLVLEDSQRDIKDAQNMLSSLMTL